MFQREMASRNRVRIKPSSVLLILSLLSWACVGTFGSTLPPYFVEEPIGGEWNEACGLTFDSVGRMFVWERGGRVWLVETNGLRLPQPLIDVSEEVGAWRDYGMLGFALDPHFELNGYFYLLYVVDRHYLKKFGTSSYDPNVNEYFQATIGRLTRYTARASDGFRTVDPTTRLVLVGEAITTGFPIMHQSHGVGTLVFGTDGTLLVSAGEGSSYTGADAGGSVGENYAAQALADGIIQAKENVGAYRSQLVDSLGGKVIRIDPATGNGVPSNPFYDSAHPRSARSRVWALGFRNPCRMTLRPGSGSANPADARPGVIYLGDVGWSGWEELNVVTRPGQNFGWPVFEGMESQSEYDQFRAQNRDAPNPLYGRAGCTQRYFTFHDLIHEDTQAPDPWFPNPCDPSQAIPASIPHFILSRAAIEWRDSARTGTYDTNGNLVIVPMGALDSPVPGPQFSGECSVGGTWYVGDDFPSNYKSTYFHGDFEQGWIRNFVFDTNDRLIAVRDFLSNGGAIVAMGTHPTQGGLYYVRWGMEVMKVSYSLDANQRPVAAASADKIFGPGPLTVQFTGANSSDPEGSPLNYRWDFGDGISAETIANPLHVYQAPPDTPTSYTATLTVTDTNGATGVTRLVISVNNTPPSVAILNPVDGSKYPLTADTVYQLSAMVSDAEYAENQLSYRWQTILHHNDHQHTEPIDSSRSPTTLISPVGCSGGESYHFRIVLIVTDPGGLSTTNEASVYPDCEGALPTETFPMPWMQRDIGAVSMAGNASYSNRNFTVAGSGDDIWGTADEFRFAYWAQTGDSQINARVVSQENTELGAKAGVMMRETLQSGSRYAMAAVTPDGLLFQYRTTPNGASAYQQVFDLTAPYWVKLIRAGNRFTGYTSPDGIVWSPFTSVTISMASAVFGGLAVTSHSDGVLSSALFDQVVGIAGVTAPSVGPLPVPWASIDIGSIILTGGSSHTGGVFTVSGSGEGIWNTDDAFRFVRRSWTGDVEIVTRLTRMQDTAAWAKAGIMVRQTTETDSPAVLLGLTPHNGVGLQSRTVTGGGSVFTRGPGLTAPTWLKLVRAGDEFSASASIDGSNWSHVGTHTIPMSAEVSVGLAVSSFDNSRLNTAQFSNVVVRTPQQPFNSGAEEENWAVPRRVPRLSLMPTGTVSQFTLKVEDHPGHRQQLERSLDLIEWRTVAVLDNRGGTTFFVDSIGTVQQQRFYRVSVLP
jgi:PKD repeat protein/regulation of enolase protein 1 (concanavalin A-like superfamily)